MLLFPQGDPKATAYIANWVALQIDPSFEVPQTGYTAMGVIDRPFHEGGQLVGGIVYTNYFSTDIEIWVAGARKADGSPCFNWVTPHNFRAAFRYPFYQLGCQRISALAKRKNKRSRELLKRMHFKEEGCKRKFFPDGQDAFVYGLLKEEYEQHWEKKSIVRLMTAA